MSLRSTALIYILNLCFSFADAQHTVIDVAKIHNFESITHTLRYFIDPEKKYSIIDIKQADFKVFHQKSLFNPRYPGGYYFAEITLINSGESDTIFFYAGKGQDYQVYEYDTATGEKILLHQAFEHYSHAVFNKVPFIYLSLARGQQKTILFQFDINFYNWNLFDPALVKQDGLDFFIFEHILQPSRIYIIIALFFLGIMFTMFANTFALFVRTPAITYLYYSIAIFNFLIYFSLRIFDVYIFSKSYHWFYEVRFEALQLLGPLFTLLFISSFFEFKKNYLPAFYAVRWIVWCQVVFLIVNISFLYSNKYNFFANIAFDIMRLLTLTFSIGITTYIILKIRNKEAQYIGIGSIVSLVMSVFALYIGKKINNGEIVLRYNRIPSLFFMIGILSQMILFLQALGHRRRMQEVDRIRAVEQLQLENDRKELEKYKAIIDARDSERTRISQEIHDDIGSGLTSIRLLSEIAKVRFSDESNKELEKISSTSNILIDKMNEIIWTLNSRNDTLLNLIAYLRHQIVEFFEPVNIILEINLPENIQDVPVSGKIRRNIILAVKEALHNIIKHSKASAVKVSFYFDGFFTITIHDNGVGFSTNNTNDHNNGLRNMKDRLTSIGGSCKITCIEGTIIFLKIPLNTYPV